MATNAALDRLVRRVSRWDKLKERERALKGMDKLYIMSGGASAGPMDAEEKEMEMESLVGSTDGGALTMEERFANGLEDTETMMGVGGMEVKPRTLSPRPKPRHSSVRPLPLPRIDESEEQVLPMLPLEEILEHAKKTHAILGSSEGWQPLTKEELIAKGLVGQSVATGSWAPIGFNKLDNMAGSNDGRSLHTEDIDEMWDEFGEEESARGSTEDRVASRVNEEIQMAIDGMQEGPLTEEERIANGLGEKQ